MVCTHLWIAMLKIHPYIIFHPCLDPFHSMDNVINLYYYILLSHNPYELMYVKNKWYGEPWIPIVACSGITLLEDLEK